jgi:glycosyltransferase involved in cell wall biosynthesis
MSAGRSAHAAGPLVAMVLQSYPPVLGGAQRQVSQLAPLLAERGIRVHVITRRVPGTPEHADEPGATVERLSVPRRGPRASAAFVAGATRRLISLRPDVIHAFDLHSPSLAALLANSLTASPVVAKVLSAGRGGDLDRLARKPLGSTRRRLIVRRFAAWHAVSDEVESELRELGVHPWRIARIVNGVDCQHHRPPSPAERLAVRRRLEIGPDEFVAMYCGRFAPVKRLDVLLDAIRESPGTLLLVGAGAQEPQLRAQAADRVLAGRVRFLPPVDDPAELYWAADAYVSASATEGMSNSVLEAMASGLPIVAARASGMEQLLRGDAGLLVPGDRPIELGGQLSRLAGDPALRQGLGRAARAAVLDRHSLPAVADELTALYRRLALAGPQSIPTGPRRGRHRGGPLELWSGWR